MAAGSSPQPGQQQHLTSFSGMADIRDPSGPDGSSSVGYMGIDFHGVAPPSSSAGFLTETQVAQLHLGNESFQHHHDYLQDSFSRLHRGQHPGNYACYYY